MIVRVDRSGLAWPVPPEIGDIDMEGRLYGGSGGKSGWRKIPEPDRPVVAREFKRKHVTLQVLWRSTVPSIRTDIAIAGSAVSFADGEGHLPLVMRQSHTDGEKLFLDYAGDTVPVVVNRPTREVRGAHIFVAVMAGSSWRPAKTGSVWTAMMIH